MGFLFFCFFNCMCVFLNHFPPYLLKRLLSVQHKAYHFCLVLLVSLLQGSPIFTLGSWNHRWASIPT